VTHKLLRSDREIIYIIYRYSACCKKQKHYMLHNRLSFTHSSLHYFHLEVVVYSGGMTRNKDKKSPGKHVLKT
jgi:hypothetical protein